jgi:arginase
MSGVVGLLGVPTSAGAFAPGQEQAPEALREAKLVESLRGLGVEVRPRRLRAVALASRSR